MFPTEIKAFNNLVDLWGTETALKISEITGYSDFPVFNADDEDHRDLSDFMKLCTACGGDWGQMLLTGIKALWPEVYDAIPDDMGVNAFVAILNVLVLCGVEI